MTSRVLFHAVLMGGVISATWVRGVEPPNGLSGTFGEIKDSAMVVPSTGAMTYAIPFQLPANRGNAQPSLGLAYESGARAGEAGLGWSLALPSIERAPLSGWPKYLDDGVAANEDRFTYNGRALTFICVVGGVPACPISERVGPLPSWAHGYRHYRLQVEGSFERFFWSPESSRWIVQERGGNILEFGLALTRPDLQLASASETDGPSGRTFRWYLAVQRDLHADRNMVFYRWATDGQGTRKYLREIYYVPPPDNAGAAPLSAFAYHVELLWEDPPYRQKDTTFADRRPHYKRLRRVAVSAKPWSVGADRQLVRAYNLSYYPERGEALVPGEAPLWGRSSLKSVQMEGRCAAPVRESGGTLPDPTGCPALPAVSFEYAPAKLAFGAARYAALGTPGTTEVLSYPTSTAVLDVNRDGLPDVLQAWPTNFRRPKFTVEYSECRDGEFIVDAGADPQTHDPQLACRPDDDTEDTVDVRPARAHKAWVNRGASPAGALTLEHHCLDAGGVEPRTPTYYQIAGPQGFGSREPSLFTQYGAEAVAEWGNGSLLWSLAGYHAFGFAPAILHRPDTPQASEEYDEPTFRKFCPESAANPSQPALRWVKTGESTWSKDSQNEDAPEYRHRNIVDIDGDGYGDLLTETVTPGTDGVFERAAVRFTRKLSRLEHVDFLPGPALYPFATRGGEAVTVTATFAEYSTYADVNGDGIVDLITGSSLQQHGVPEVRLGDGRGGFGCDPSADIACQIPGNGPGTGDWLGRGYLLFTPDKPVPSPFDPQPWPLVADFRFQARPAHFIRDVTGDGLADIVKYVPPAGTLVSGRLLLWVNVDGRTFRCANSSDCVVATIGGAGSPVPLVDTVHHALIADMDGNGSEDFVLISGAGLWTFSFLVDDPVPPSGPRSPRPGLLTRIRNGVGADIEIVYETIQELDRAASSADPASFQRPWTQHVPQVLPVVTRLATRDTSSAKGSPLAQPYAINRTRRFEFREPAYDPWQRAFKGFHQVRSVMPSGEVTQSWFYYGPCEAGGFVQPGCLHGSDGGNDGAGNGAYLDKALVGLVARVDRFVPGGGDRPDRWLSTRTTAYDSDVSWISPAGAKPDRPVVLGRVARVDTYLYDTALPVSVVDDIARPVVPQRAPGQSARVHLRNDTAYDAAGNVMVEKRYGRVNDGNAAAAEDAPLTSTYLPSHGRCGPNWQCLAAESTLSERPTGTLADRPLRHSRSEYNGNGDLIEVQGRLFPTSSVQPGLQRDPLRGVGAPASAQLASGWKTLNTYELDDLGNVTATRGAPGPNQACARASFDALFRQFPETVSQFSGAACGGLRLSDESVYDRGLGTVLETRSSDRTLRTIELDGFGRVTKVQEPTPDGGPFATQLSLEVTRHTREPLTWVEANRRVGPDEFITSIDVFNGVGEHVVGFDEADPAVDGAPWVLREWKERDGNGRLSAGFRPWFFSGDARLLADSATALAPQGLRAATFYDAFGRPLIAFDGTLAVAEYVYTPLAVSAKDAERRKPAGPFAGLDATARRDGHGRTIETITPTADGPATMRAEYLGTGEMLSLRRSSSKAPDVYERRMSWDSFGRLISNVEPNSSGPDAAGVVRSWRYVYDDEGRLVGTSDARGCGKNLHYDALGRIRAEDFSPCAPGQPAYTAPDLASGDGTEAFYRYDTYPQDTLVPTPLFANRAEAAVGRLVSVQDLGAHTRFSYDERGRVRRTTRQTVKPGSPSAALATRYASHWFKQEAEFDFGDRLRKRTLGLEREPFPADSSETFAYSSRGVLRGIGSSFGELVSELKTSPSGLPLQAKYGDLAATRTAMGYDTRDRLRKWRTSRASAPPLWALPSTADYSQPDGTTTQLDLVDLEVSYDDVGNVLVLNDGSAANWPPGAKPVSRAFAYDPGYRLAQVDYFHGDDAYVPAVLPEALARDRRPVAEQPGRLRVGRQSFATDWQGNVTRAEDNEALRFDRSLGPVFNGIGRDGQRRGPNQLVDADGIHATYDRAGNLTELTVARGPCWSRMPECSHRFRYDWDAVGQLARARRWDHPAGPVPASAAGLAPVWDMTFAYSEGARTRTSVMGAAGATSHTLDVFDTLRIDRASYQPATSTYRLTPQNQVAFAGGVARVFLDRERALPMAGASPVHVYFNIRDYLGSSAFSIDKDSGEVVERATYQAFGATEADYRPERWAGAREDFKFTGKEESLEVGATFFGARYYNTRLGRWMSPDPLTIHGLAGDPNPYAYVSGRVTTLTDPQGLDGVPAGLKDVQYHGNGEWSGVNADGMIEFGNLPTGPVRDPVSFERLTERDQLHDAFETLEALQFVSKLAARGKAVEDYHEAQRRETESPYSGVYFALDLVLGDVSRPLEPPDNPYGEPVWGAATPTPQAALVESAAARALTIHRAAGGLEKFRDYNPTVLLRQWEGTSLVGRGPTRGLTLNQRAILQPGESAVRMRPDRFVERGLRIHPDMRVLVNGARQGGTPQILSVGGMAFCPLCVEGIEAFGGVILNPWVAWFPVP